MISGRIEETESVPLSGIGRYSEYTYDTLEQSGFYTISN